MTKKQWADYHRMRHALITITKFQSTERLRSKSFEDWGLEYDEAIEMAYENIKEIAKQAVHGVRKIQTLKS